MTAGRPTSYREEYCDRVLEFGARGKSIAWMAAELGVSRPTLEENWPAAHPQFLEALTRARLLSQQWWEDAGQDGMEKQGFNASIWSRSMAARFPHDWREVKGTEHSGAIDMRTKEQRDAAVNAAQRADT